ncbi:MAG: hypothetical protein ACD_60C00034G0004 [uncultured bacterium]|nr:MAG: hypothetical protein ACD_60C00034G0004 [uncultured bacterium]
MSTLDDVFEKWTTDADFRKEFKKNPQKALEKAGIRLNTDDLQKVLTAIGKQEELEKKMNR